MPEVGAQVDPQILKDLLSAEQLCRLLGTAGQRIEFWESYALLRSDPALIAGEIARLSGMVAEFRRLAPDPAVLEKLRFLRSDMGPLVQHLRQFFAVLPEPVDPSRLDMLIVFIVSSPQGREAAVRWVADPVGCRDEAAVRIKIMTALVEAYRRALLEAHVAASPPREQTPPAAAGKEESPAPEPRGPDPLLGAIRLADRCRGALAGTPIRAETWELVCLALSDASGLRKAVNELNELRVRGKPGEFAGAAYAFRQMVGRVREQHGLWVDRLSEYAAGLNLSGWDDDTRGMVIGLLVVSPRGRARVERWFQRPKESLNDAASFLGRLITRAIKALKAHREGLQEGSPAAAGGESGVAFD